MGLFASWIRFKILFKYMSGTDKGEAREKDFQTYFEEKRLGQFLEDITVKVLSNKPSNPLLYLYLQQYMTK
jgi:hypothetical protein